MSFTLNDLVTDTIEAVENRTSDNTRALKWLRDALIEITSNGEYRDDFVELEVTGPVFNLTANVQEYAETNFITGPDLNMATLDMRIWDDPPTNSRSRKLKPSHYQKTDESSTLASRPSEWYRFGGNLGFYSVPDAVYQVQARCLKYHPINDSDLGSTTILIPRDWNEIIVQAAAVRGFKWLEEFEKAGQIHQFLFGDPDQQKKGAKPGLISGRIKKRANEAWRQQQALRPTIRRYT